MFDDSSSFFFGFLLLGVKLAIVISLGGLEVDLETELRVLGHLQLVLKLLHLDLHLLDLAVEDTLGAFELVRVTSRSVLRADQLVELGLLRATNSLQLVDLNKKNFSFRCCHTSRVGNVVTATNMLFPSLPLLVRYCGGGGKSVDNRCMRAEIYREKSM